MGITNFIQFNMNHSPGAQDLVLQFMKDQSIDIGCFSEVRYVPDKDPNWFCSDNEKAAIYCNNSVVRRDIRFVASSRDWVCVKLRDIFIISCYLSPNEGMARFKQSLKEMRQRK